MPARRREPACLWNTRTKLTVINTAALTHCINCSPPQTPRAVVTPDSLAWAAIASLSEDEYIFSPLEIYENSYTKQRIESSVDHSTASHGRVGSLICPD